MQERQNEIEESPSPLSDKAVALFAALMTASFEENRALIELLKNPQTCDSQEQALMNWLPFLQEIVDANGIESLPIPLFFIPALMACGYAPENSSVSEKFRQRLVDFIAGEVAQGNIKAAQKYTLFTDLHLRAASRPDIAATIRKTYESSLAERGRIANSSSLAGIHAAVAMPQQRVSFKALLTSFEMFCGDSIFDSLKNPETCGLVQQRLYDFIQDTDAELKRSNLIPQCPIFFVPALVVCLCAPQNSDILKEWRGYLIKGIAEQYHGGNVETGAEYKKFVTQALSSRSGVQITQYEIDDAEISLLERDRKTAIRPAL
ncbi:MAG: hypothetical protein IT558_00045 [Alphaproteobacteria bacterium]|nr:hypothetical protein [Alphaproteobacteria bacterium]